MLIGMFRAIGIVASCFTLVVTTIAAPTQRVVTEPLKQDRHGDPLPAGVTTRLGTVRFRGEVARATDGKSLATLRRNRVVFIDPETGAERRELPGPNPTEFEVWRFVLSTDGRFVAYGGATRIEIWDISAGQRVGLIDSRDEAETYSPDREHGPIAFSPDGKLLLFQQTDPNDPVCCWDIIRDEIRWRLNNHSQEFSPAHAIGWTRDGQHAVVIRQKENDCELSLVRSENAEIEHSFEMGQLGGHGHAICALSPDGNEFAFFEQGDKLRRIEIPTGQTIASQPKRDSDGKTIKGAGLADFQGNDVVTLAYSADSKKLAIVQMTSVRLFDLASGRELGKSRENAEFFGFRDCRAAFTGDGKSLWIVHDEERAWKLIDGTSARAKRLADLGHRNAITAVAISPDGKLIATGNEEESARIWDAATGQSIRQLTSQPVFLPVFGNSGIKSLCFHPDGKSLIGGAHDGRVLIWDPSTGRLRRQIRVPGESTIDKIALDRSGETLAVAQDLVNPIAQDCVLRIYRFADGTERFKLANLNGSPTTLNFSPDGKYLAAANNNNDAGSGTMIFDVTTGRIYRTIPGECYAAHFMPVGNTLVYATPEGISIWELCSGTARLQITNPPNDMIDVLAISPDGKTLAGANNSAGTRRIYRWDLRTGESLPPLIGHDHHITELAYAADGRLVSGSQDTTALVWPPRTDVARISNLPTTEEELSAAWRDLARDGLTAHTAMERLIAVGDVAVNYAQKHLQPATSIDPRIVNRFLDRLDAMRFADRQKAVSELEAMDFQAEPFLRRAADTGTSAETRRATSRLLERLDGPVSTPDLLRGLRAVEILQRIGTSDARQLLEKLAAGDRHARLTHAAQATLKSTIPK
jgi:WD40 repeat protein